MTTTNTRVAAMTKQVSRRPQRLKTSLRKSSSSLSLLLVFLLSTTTTTQALSLTASKSCSFVSSSSSLWPTWRRPQSRHGWQMHMGHSHSHHHHHHNDNNDATTALSWQRGSLAAVTAAVGYQVRHPVVRTAAWLVAAFLMKKTVLQAWQEFQHDVAVVAKHATPALANRNANAQQQNTQNTQQQNHHYAAADRVTYIGMVLNLALAAGKLVVGTACHSRALLADAGHSLSDLWSDVITVASTKVGRLPPDDDHPYGHGKFEAVGSLFLALTLLATAVSVAAASAKPFLNIGASVVAPQQQPPTPPALVMAAVSIVSKEWLYRITYAVGRAMGSPVVVANAWHHRSDAYSSVLALVSIALALRGWVAADALAGIVVAGMIGRTGVQVLWTSLEQLTDTVDARLVARVEQVLLQPPQQQSSTTTTTTTNHDHQHDSNGKVEHRHDYAVDNDNDDGHSHHHHDHHPAQDHDDDLWSLSSTTTTTSTPTTTTIPSLAKQHIEQIRARHVGSSALVEVAVIPPNPYYEEHPRQLEDQLEACLSEQLGVDVDVRAVSTTATPTATHDENRQRLLLAHPDVVAVSDLGSTITIRLDADRVTTMAQARAITRHLQAAVRCRLTLDVSY